jgi:hypothetical protein
VERARAFDWDRVAERFENVVNDGCRGSA